MPSIPVSRTFLAIALSALVGLAGAGCGDTETDTGRPPTGASSTELAGRPRRRAHRSTQPDTDLREPAGRSHESHHHHR